MVWVRGKFLFRLPPTPQRRGLRSLLFQPQVRPQPVSSGDRPLLRASGVSELLAHQLRLHHEWGFMCLHQTHVTILALTSSVGEHGGVNDCSLPGGPPRGRPMWSASTEQNQGGGPTRPETSSAAVTIRALDAAVNSGRARRTAAGTLQIPGEPRPAGVGLGTCQPPVKSLL